MTDAPIDETAPDGENIPPASPDDGAPPPFFELSRLMVVAIDSSQANKLVWKAQKEPNGSWGDEAWTPINDTAYLVLGVGSTMDGRVAVVAQTQDSPTVHYLDETPQGPDGAEKWNAPVDLGLPKGVGSLIQLLMTRDADGRIEVFGLDDRTGDVWWIFQNPPKVVTKKEKIIPPGQTEPIEVEVRVSEPPDQPWSDWQTLPGVAASRLSIGNNADGRIVLVATAHEQSKNLVYLTQQKNPTALAPDNWTGWDRFDTVDSSFAADQPSIALDSNGAVNIFMVCQYDQIAQRRQTQPGALTWGSWIRPGMTDNNLIEQTTAVDGDGHLILMAIDEKNGLYANFQQSAVFQVWTGWRKVGIAPGTGLLATDFNADGRVSFFVDEAKNNSLHMLTQSELNSTSWDAGFTFLSAHSKKGLLAYGVVRDLTPPGGG